MNQTTLFCPPTGAGQPRARSAARCSLRPWVRARADERRGAELCERGLNTNSEHRCRAGIVQLIQPAR